MVPARTPIATSASAPTGAAVPVGPAARAVPTHDDVAILTRFERAELAGAACTLGDLVRELRRSEAPARADDVLELLEAYHRHLRSAYRACPADGAAPVLAFSSFARTSRRVAVRPAVS